MKALGIDVGLHNLDLVLLDRARQVERTLPRLSHSSLRDLVLELRPDIVTIDSPARWAPPGGRATEHAMRKLNVQLYATPSSDSRSLKGFHDWMEAGIAVFEAVASDYPLFDGSDLHRRTIEVFPHASAVVLAGHLKPKEMGKHEWRQGVLSSAGVEGSRLRSGDLVDAALGALTGLLALEGRGCWFGRPEEGVIVLPCLPSEVPVRYGLRSEARVAPVGRHCTTCGWQNPPISRFCNQCGSRLPEFENAVRK